MAIMLWSVMQQINNLIPSGISVLTLECSTVNITYSQSSSEVIYLQYWYSVLPALLLCESQYSIDDSSIALCLYSNTFYSIIYLQVCIDVKFT